MNSILDQLILCPAKGKELPNCNAQGGGVKEIEEWRYIIMALQLKYRRDWLIGA